MTEHEEQVALMQRVHGREREVPELLLLHAIPNGGWRNAITAARLQAEGVTAGVPDLCLPVARKGCHGLYIELKRERDGHATDDQRAWLSALMDQGYYVALCEGWRDAWRTLCWYLEVDPRL